MGRRILSRRTYYSTYWLTAALAIGLAACSYCAGWIHTAFAKEAKPAAVTAGDYTARAVATLDGMDCEGDAALSERNPSQARGVSNARVNLQSTDAQVEYEPGKVDLAWLNEAIIAAPLVGSATPFRSVVTASGPPVCVQPLLTELSTEVEPLRSDFNRNASSTRLLLILSPS
jgi:copper chaperone CopZ